LELRYTQQGGPESLELPVFPEEPAVQQVYLAAYLPKEWTYLGSMGPWTDELNWQVGHVERRATANQDDSSLIYWVSEEVNVDGSVLNSFPTDGQMLLFSTLRPQVEGKLELWTMHENWLVGWMIVLVMAAGLWLLRSSWKERVVAVAALVIGLMLCGVFAPSFSYQILDWKLITAVTVVLFVWVAKWLLFDRPTFASFLANLKQQRDSVSQWKTPVVTPPPVARETANTEEKATLVEPIDEESTDQPAEDSSQPERKDPEAGPPEEPRDDESQGGASHA
jgi:hypothetical protein